ncbi:unnamed protein product [Rotaria sp. Silwood2]|nr:unnamed protein product [Rotaria sp. Silwood2]CAF2553035.1 unnamed protein product [Rotaria sp. Silwood2]CAF2960871.1 unnamed protein product [Rotaria sp. Silwood2]CAF3918231.1 unnamed protein product [Rotaria sp. Silwood2]CAF3922168.1 unnamed protein product [Rotaria sp. Silwood2]
MVIHLTIIFMITETGVICAANIYHQIKTGGGGPFNIIKDLRLIDKNLPLSIVGLLGNDDNGQCQRGTNSLLSSIHFDFNYLVNEKHCTLFYLGYLTLLDGLDQIINNETIAAKAQLTLPFVDHLILNEIEIGLILNQSFQQGTISQIEQAARILIENYGIQRTVTVHFDCGAVCVSRENNLNIECFYQGSLYLPQGYIKSAVGTGDAFAAGIIYGIYKNWSIQERLRCGICVAAMCLKDLTSYGGVGTIEECLQLKEAFCFRTLELTSSIHDIEN